MILVDKKPLDVSTAIQDYKHPQYEFAKLYNETMQEMKTKFQDGYVRFIRPGVPKHSKGYDSSGREIPKLKEPTPPWRIPLQAYATVGKIGKHLFGCCLDQPEVLPNGLWDMGKQRSMSIKENVLVNIDQEPDLAFFLYKISPFVKRSLIKVFDPKAIDDAIGEEARELTERKYAVWNMLSDEVKLRMMAKAYGISGVDKKTPNAIRKELEEVLERNDKLKKQNRAVRGTKEFLEEMMVTEGVLLRNFVMKAYEDKKLNLGQANGWVKIGEKQILQIPATDIKDLPTKINYVCNFLLAGVNFDRLQEFVRDLMDKEYLDSVTNFKELQWLAKVSKTKPSVGKPSDIKTGLQTFYFPE